MTAMGKRIEDLDVSTDMVRTRLNEISEGTISNDVLDAEIGDAKTFLKGEAGPKNTDTDLKRAIAAVAAYNSMAYDPDANARNIEEFDLRETFDPGVMETRTGKKAVQMLNAVRPGLTFEPL